MYTGIPIPRNHLAKISVKGPRKDVALCLWDSTAFWLCSAPAACDSCTLPAGQRKQGDLSLHIFLVASARRFPAEHEKLQYLSGFSCDYAKKELGKAGLFHAVSCRSARANLIVGSSSDPMVIGQGARDSLPG